MQALSDEFFNARKAEVKKRVSKRRYEHIKGVSKTAEKLAKRYDFSDEDIAKAKLAGLLHDWDKGYDDEGIRNRVIELGIEDEVGEWVMQNMPRVIHGITAATALSREYPEIPKDVIDAIYKHTTASNEMSDLAKVIYIADAIEPSREFKDIDYLRSSIDIVSLDELYYRIYKFWTAALIEHDTVLYPETITIWNNLASKHTENHKGKKKSHKGNKW